MIRFELPQVLYKVILSYDLTNVPKSITSEVSKLSESYFFKDINLAEEFYHNFNNKDKFLEFYSKNGDFYELNLKIITNFDVINTLDIIPKVVDL